MGQAMNNRNKTILSAIKRDKLIDAILDLADSEKSQPKKRKLIHIANLVRHNWS
jgi:hypothetical protein